MATAWCRDSGIAAKVMSDTVEKSVADEGRYVRVRPDQPLTFVHLMTASIVFVVGLFLSGIAFCGELFSRQIDSKEGMKAATDEDLEFPEQWQGEYNPTNKVNREEN